MDPRLLIDIEILRQLSGSPARVYLAAVKHAAMHGGRFDLTAREVADAAETSHRSAARTLSWLRDQGVLVFDSSSRAQHGRRLPDQRVKLPLVRVGQGTSAVDIHEEDI